MTARVEKRQGAPSGEAPPVIPGVTGLLRKDLAVFILRDRLLIGMVYLLAHPMVFPSEEAFFWLGICLAGALALYLPIIEWHQETDRMLSSLPVRRATVVYSRFLSSILATILAGVAWVSSGFLLAPFFGSVLDPGHSMLPIWTTFEGILGFFLVAVLLLCLFLPLYFRFGLGRAATLFVGLCFGLFAIVSFSVGLVQPGGLVRSRLSSLAASVGPGLTLFLALGGLAGIVAASGRLSVQWFEKRDL